MESGVEVRASVLQALGYAFPCACVWVNRPGHPGPSLGDPCLGQSRAALPVSAGFPWLTGSGHGPQALPFAAPPHPNPILWLFVTPSRAAPFLVKGLGFLPCCWALARLKGRCSLVSMLIVKLLGDPDCD